MDNEISVKKAAAINAIAKYSRVVFFIILNMFLARVISPDEFGIVAIINVFVNFFMMFTDMGVGPAVIQNKELNEEDLKSIFSFSIILGLILGILFIAFSYPISIFYNNKVFVPLGSVLAISLIFNTFNTVPNAILMKKKAFTIVAIRTIVAYLFSCIISGILALYGWSYYAVAMQAVLYALGAFVWNYIAVKPGFTIRIQIKCIKKIASFSIFQALFNFVNYFSRNLDNLLTGKFMGTTDLGYYNKAYELMLYPNSMLTGVLTPVLHPILSDYQNKKDVIYKKYVDIIHILFIFGLFVTGVCLIASDEIIRIAYGDRWMASAPCLFAMSFSMVFQVVTASTGAIFQSLNSTRNLFKVGIINTCVNILAIFVGVINKSILILSIAISIAYIINFIIAYSIMMNKVFNTSFLGFIKEYRSYMLIYFVLIFLTYIYPFNVENYLVSFFIKILYISVLYFVLLLFTRNVYILGILKRCYQRLKSRYNN